MQKIRQSIGYFAASGCAASYTELFDSDGVYNQLKYLNEHFYWPRVAYRTKYQQVLNQQ